MNNRKKKVLIIILSVFLFLFLVTLFINLDIIYSTRERIINIDNQFETSDIDAIVILGCKIEGNRPSLMLSKRLDKGIEVYNKLHTKIILSGNGNKEENEIEVMKNYLLSSYINPSDIYLDYEGFTTYDSIYRVKNVFNAKRVIIVTQEYHIYRALYLANKLDLDAYGISANDIPQKFIMFKNQVREILARDKNFFKGLLKPKSNYNSEIKQYVLEG